MSQPKMPLRKLPNQGFAPDDLHNFLEIVRLLDRSLVEISMHIYGVPHQQRVKMREQHSRLHETIRRRVPHWIKNHPGRRS